LYFVSVYVSRRILIMVQILSRRWSNSLAKLVGSLLALWLVFGVSSFEFQSHTVLAAGQDGAVDPTFKSGSGPNERVLAVAVQLDGKILIGGSFTTYNASARNRIARLNPDGSLDTGFLTTGTGVGGEVTAIAVQSDGKILIGGLFTTYNGTTRNGIARLNADGSIDTGFLNTGTGVVGLLYAIALQPDGKILIGGNFSSYNGSARNRIARLNADGSLDTNFDPGTGTNNSVNTIALQPDGKILIGGYFTTYNGTARNRLARLNADGSLDTGFLNTGAGANSGVLAITRQSDGKILIGGLFTTYNGSARNRIARLNADGSLDTGFLNTGTGANSDVKAIALQPDGKILIGGLFTTYNDTARNRIARLNSNGSLDTNFNPGTGVNDGVFAIALQPDSKMLIGGEFDTYNGVGRNGLARLNADGSLDTGFLNTGTGANSPVNAIAVQPDGKILIGGFFTTYNDTERNRIARLNVNGSLDTNFNPGTGVNKRINVITLQPNDKILIGGEFDTYNGVGRNNIARLNANGSLDTGFLATGIGGDEYVDAIVLQPDGKILIGGGFTTFNGTARKNIARLNADGSLDTNFDPGTGTNNSVNAIALQPDGKIIIGGNFTTYNGTARNRIARLNTNGSIDTNFDPGTGTDAKLNTVVVQSDGKIIIGGNFTTYNSTGRNNIARLNANGSLDTNFDPGTGTGGSEIGEVRLQPGGKIIIGGNFTSYNGTGRNNIARLNADGSLDTNFDPGAGANGGVEAVALQVDGKVLIGGLFRSVDTYTRDGIARLENTVCNPLVVTNSSDNGTGATCGTFSYATLNATSGMTITFAVTNVTFSGVPTPSLQAGVVLDGGANGVTLDGGTLPGDGLVLGGNNRLINLTIKGFNGRGLVVPSGSGSGSGKTNNKLDRVKVIKT
jgi:uncharacterized delta-60 repeat protein